MSPRTVAEREGFEPPIRLPVFRISSAVRLTTLPPLRGRQGREAPRRSAAMYPTAQGETRAAPAGQANRSLGRGPAAGISVAIRTAVCGAGISGYGAGHDGGEPGHPVR
jgi:hypothetical protein